MRARRWNFSLPLLLFSFSHSLPTPPHFLSPPSLYLIPREREEGRREEREEGRLWGSRKDQRDGIRRRLTITST